MWIIREVHFYIQIKLNLSPFPKRHAALKHPPFFVSKVGLHCLESCYRGGFLKKCIKWLKYNNAPTAPTADKINWGHKITKVALAESLGRTEITSKKFWIGLCPVVALVVFTQWWGKVVVDTTTTNTLFKSHSMHKLQPSSSLFNRRLWNSHRKPHKPSSF